MRTDSLSPLVRRGLTFSRFDRMMALVAAGLVAAIALTILFGDRVGVTLERVAPLGIARSTSPVLIQFSEAMDRASVETRLRLEEIAPEAVGGMAEAITAPLSGRFSWTGSTVTFQPERALRPGAAYQVVLVAGAQAEYGREVLNEYRYSFTVRTPRIAFMAPADSAPLNLWLVDPADPASARPITDSPGGIYDYAVSPDGTRIAFAERTTLGTSDIKLLTLETGVIQQLTNCPDSECRTPSWRPDGRVIAYERIDWNSDFQQVGPSPTRIWLLDLSTTPPATRPLFDDTQILGYGLRWSADGERVTLYNFGAEGILLHDFIENRSILIPSRYGNPGELSPDGTRVIFPEIALNEAQASAYLQLVDVTTDDPPRRLSTQDEPVDDDSAIWSPDGAYLVIARRYMDERYTRGKQLYRMDPADGSTTPLLVDPAYQHGFYAFDPTASRLVIQRFPDPTVSTNPNDQLGLPEVWLLDLVTGEPALVADNAIFPRWVP